jgi:predicted esterase
MGDVVDCTFSSQLDCHYLLSSPEVVTNWTPVVLALHGFGANPETMMHLTRRLFESPPVLASLQGPNQFFLGSEARHVGYGWLTNRRPAESIRLHHDMVRHTLRAVGQQFGIPAGRRVLVGFSQSVALNYRFAATYPEEIGGVIGICGGLPSDWEENPVYRPVTASVLHIARRQDQYYPPEVTGRYPVRLKQRMGDVEFLLIDGGHQIPSEGQAIVDPWMRRILPAAGRSLEA